MYHEFGPPSSLTPWVDHFWSSTGPRTRETIISPDGCIDIIVTPSAGTAKVVGAMTRSVRLPASATSDVYGVRFRPGGSAPCLRVPADLLTDRVIDLRDLWKQDEVDRLCDSENPFSALQRAVAQRGSGQLPDRRVESAIALLQHADVHQISAAVGLSRQQLTRLFKQTVGVGPKRLARILRLRRLIEQLRSGTAGDREDLVHCLGFYDVSHLSREVRELVGCSLESLFEAARSGRL